MDGPYIWTKIQYAKEPSDLPQLDKKGTTCIQKINGRFLYYARGVDGCMLVTTNEPINKQPLLKKLTMLLLLIPAGSKYLAGLQSLRTDRQTSLAGLQSLRTDRQTNDVST